MDAVPNQVFFPSGFQELFSLWSRFPDAIPYAGGTGFIRNQTKLIPELPRNILSLDKMDELRRITRTERYLEIGAMVKLNEIVRLGKIVPEILTRTLEGIAGLHVRNIATIGGNLCEKSCLLDTLAPMAALDAHFELRNSSSSRWISASRFISQGISALNPQELLTRIRIPLEQWNYSLYRKFKSSEINQSGSTMIFILKNQKNILTDLRVIYSGNVILSDRQSETFLIGKKLPLDRKDALAFHASWNRFLQSMETLRYPVKTGLEGEKGELFKIQILNFIEDALSGIAD